MQTNLDIECAGLGFTHTFSVITAYLWELH